MSSTSEDLDVALSSVDVQSSYCVYLKVLSPSNKKDFNMFTLRDIMPDELLTVEDLKGEVFIQCGEVANLPHSLEFKIGYYHRSKKLWINNEHDLNDAVNIIRRNEKLTLWALSASSEGNKKRRRSLDDDDDSLDTDLTGKKKQKSVSAAELRKTRQRELKESLQAKHGPKYNAMQYTFWAEAILAETHSSTDEPPGAPLFNSGKPRRSGSTLTEAFSGLASSISDVMKHNAATTSNTAPANNSPNKMSQVALRSKYLEQLREIHSLFEMGVLNAAEYEEQRKFLVGQMCLLNKPNNTQYSQLSQ